MSVATLSAPSAAVSTALMLTENWLNTVFSHDPYTVARDPGDDPAHLPVLVVTRAHTDAPPVLVVAVTDAPVTAATADFADRYAAAGAREVWVLEVRARLLHTFRDPKPDPTAPAGASFAQVRAHPQYALVSPLSAELHLAQVVNLLPW
jgi:hypothetical protein